MSIHERARNVVLSVAITATISLAGPASATSPTCPGAGQATLSHGISYFPTVALNVGFAFTFNCAEGGLYTGRGTLSSASCGRSSGAGTISGLEIPFTFETVGSMLFARETNGDVVMSLGNATPIPDTSTVPFGNSCSNGTAKVFQLTGGAMCVDTSYGAECLALRDYD